MCVMFGLFVVKMVLGRLFLISVMLLGWMWSSVDLVVFVSNLIVVLMCSVSSLVDMLVLLISFDIRNSIVWCSCVVIVLWLKWLLFDSVVVSLISIVWL